MVKYQPFPMVPRNVFGARSESRGQPGLGVEESRAPETRKVMEPRRGKVAACPEAEGKGTVTRGAGTEEQRYGVFSDRRTDSGGLHQARPFQVKPPGALDPSQEGWPMQLRCDPRGVNLASRATSVP